MDSLPDFLALTADRPASEVEHALAVAAAVAHHIDRQKETDMKRFPFNLAEYLRESDHERYQAAVAKDNAEREAAARAYEAARAARKAEKGR